MNTIHKYRIETTDTQSILMPKGAEILTVQVQYGEPCLWAKVNPSNDMTLRTILTAGTGHELPSTRTEYIGTYQLLGGDLVFHVFEEIDQ